MKRQVLTWNALPSDPEVAGEGSRAAWEEPLERTPALLGPLMAQPVPGCLLEAGLGRGGLRRHSRPTGQHTRTFEAAVCAVGGWADGCSDAVLCLLAGLPGSRKGLLGPW